MTLSAILHPTDLTAASEVAFDHALRIAIATGGRLTVLHVDEEGAHTSPAGLPHVGAKLGRWGVDFAVAGTPAPVTAAGGTTERRLNIEKVNVRGDAIDAILAVIQQQTPDLVVLASHRVSGVGHLLHRAVAVPVAFRTRAMTMFVPHGARGFVGQDDGVVTLRSVLVPVDHVPPPQLAIGAAAALAAALGCAEVSFTALHVGAPDDAPAVQVPERPGWSWTRATREGAVVEGILRTAWSTGADLMVVATQGHASVLDALRGSTTERLLAEAPCPLLAVPAAS